ncbi:hypothetical protein D3C84_545260 [compost metagenome]
MPTRAWAARARLQASSERGALQRRRLGRGTKPNDAESRSGSVLGPRSLAPICWGIRKQPERDGQYRQRERDPVASGDIAGARPPGQPDDEEAQ